MIRAGSSTLRPYAERTEVPVERSKGEVERMLTKAGAEAIATLVGGDRFAVGFRLAGRSYRIMVTLPDERRLMRAAGRNSGSSAVMARLREQGKRQRWRALAFILRAKLEASLSGVTELETELLPYAILPSGRSVAEEVTPRLLQAYRDGGDVPLLPGAN